MKDPDWIPEQDVNNNNNQNLIERTNLETDESRDNQNNSERVLGEDRNNGIDENECCGWFVGWCWCWNLGRCCRSDYLNWCHIACKRHSSFYAGC
jgi:hypothetical protein